MGYDNGINTYKKAITNSDVLSKTVSKPPINATTLGCTDYYLVTYWSDGSEDWQYIGTSCSVGCTIIKQIGKPSTSNATTDGLISTDCTSGGGGGSSSNTDDLKSLVNKITDPCLKNVVDKLTKSTLNNTITNILQTVFGINNQINIEFDQNSNLKSSNGSPIPGQTAENISGTVVTETVMLNPADLAGSSQEYQASVIIHEIIHEDLFVNPTVLSQWSQHLEIGENYIDKIASSITSFYPSVALKAAQSLALMGVADFFSSGTQVPVSYWNQMVAHYGFTTKENDPNGFDYLGSFYRTGDMGNPCSVSGVPKT
jgi:hypothetical protein